MEQAGHHDQEDVLGFLSLELNMHPNRQFPAHFVVHMPLCLHVLCIVVPRPCAHDLRKISSLSLLFVSPCCFWCMSFCRRAS